MKVRKVCVSTITMLIIASQLCGCASSTQKEMLNMYNNNQSITIEIANPVSQEQGTEVEFEWKELASLDTYENFRFTVEDALSIITLGEAGKNGVLYVDLEGNHTNNSTMMYAFMNQKFRDSVWSDSDTLSAIIAATKENYADVESDAVAKVAFLNAYYNIFNDAEPSYFNGYQTLTRAEFLEGIYKACNPVSELEVNQDLMAAVDSTGKDTSVPFASAMLEYNYLGLADKSLNNGTYNSTISRAEAIYTLVQMFYKTEYDATTGKESAYSDTKNGGDIATKIGLIQTDKKTGVVTTHDYLTSYELSYALQNPDGGMPDDLYRAMVVARNHGIITSTESRWDEGITKGEALTFLVNMFNNMNALTNSDRGISNGEVVNQIDWESINPATHSTYNSEDNTVTIDDEIVEYMLDKCPAFDLKPRETTKALISIYLVDYYNGRFGDNEWLQFATYGDNTVLNLAVTDAELEIMSEQLIAKFLETEEGKQAQQELEETLGTEAEREQDRYEFMAEQLGMSVDEIKALLGVTDGNGGSAGNGGGGSSHVATPDTQQPNANENTFVTPETDNPSGGNPGGSGGGGNSGSIIDFGAAADANGEAAGDGGDIITDITLNP